jgi:putative oxidoreductase
MNEPTTTSKTYRWFLQPLAIDGTLLFFRIALGAGLLTHGWGKITSGAAGVIKSATEMGFPLPEFFGWSAALSESLGGIMIAFGLMTRPWAVLGAITMLVAGMIRLADDPFGKKELALVYFVMLAVLYLLGPGRLSLDQFLFGRRRDGV